MRGVGQKCSLPEGKNTEDVITSKEDKKLKVRIGVKRPTGSRD